MPNIKSMLMLNLLDQVILLLNCKCVNVLINASKYQTTIVEGKEVVLIYLTKNLHEYSTLPNHIK